MPSDAALSMPKVKASSARMCQKQVRQPPTAADTAIQTSAQRTPERLPSSQNMMPRACSALADLAMTKAVSALKSRSEEHTSELQSLMRISYAVFCLKKKKSTKKHTTKDVQ